MPEAEAQKKFLDSISDPAERYEMEKFLKLSPADRLRAAQQEVIDNYDKTHVLQNGQHFVDEAWIVDNMMRRLKGNQTPTKEGLIRAYQNVQAAIKCIQKHKAAARKAAIKTAREREAREYGVVHDADALEAQAEAERQMNINV